jgi:uncharacterized protein with FMN-binding domain
MRRIVLWFMSTVTVVVLLFGYHTSTSSELVSGGSTVLSSPAERGTGSTSSGTGGTVTGPSVDTRWGPVQVEITVADGRITDVAVVDFPNGSSKDRQINAHAIPVLVRETLDAQSARVDMVSGATVTSEGYLESLQAALDQAGL